MLVLLFVTLGASLLFSNTSAFAAKDDKLTKSEIKKLKDNFHFSDEHIADLVEDDDGALQRYLNMKNPKVTKDSVYYVISKGKGKREATKVTKGEFEELLEKEKEKNKKKKKTNGDDDGLIKPMDYDPNNDHDFISTETWFTYDEDEGDALAEVRFEFEDDDDYYGFTGELYDDVVALGVSDNGALVDGTEDYYLKYTKYGFDGEYDDYGYPIEEWTPITRNDSAFDEVDAGGGLFNVNYPSLNTQRYQYIKNIRGYARSDVTHRNSTWDNQLYDVYSYYLYAEEEIDWGGEISIPLGGAISIGTSEDYDRITGVCQERIDM